MRGRKIFGGLEPWDKVWRTGANFATKIKFSTPVKLNGTEIAAGSYELFTIPNPTEWAVIIAKDSSEWGAYTYDAKNDIARIKAKPVATPNPVETFAIGFADLRDESATLYLTWENTRVPVKLEVDVSETLVPQIEAVMSSDASNKPYFQAAIFYLEHNLDLKKAAGWMDAALAAQPDAFYIAYHRARLLAKMGDKAGATASAQKSIELAQKAGGRVGDEYTRLNQALLERLR
jgi:tetratricopeptide (TPR) repeat protein